MLFRSWNVAGSEQMRLTSAGLGIGTSSSSTKLQISGAVSTNNEARFLAKISDTSSVVQGNGGGIIFQGVYTGSTLVDASGVQAYKTNSTDGDYGYGLAFVTRANGGNLLANMRLDGSGNLGLGATPASTNKMQIGKDMSGGGNWLVLDDTRSGYGDWAFYKVGSNDLTIGYEIGRAHV